MMNKNKKSNNRKTILTTGGIAVVCIALLIGTYLLRREPVTNFTPAPAESSTPTSTWDENTNTDTKLSEDSTTEDTQLQGNATDQTQSIVTEDESGSTSNLSDSKTKKESAAEKPQEKPIATDDTTNPDKQPDYGSSTPSPEASSPPAGNSTDSANTPAGTDGSVTSGKVYDPVFAWVTPSNVQQDNVDSDGDINKQIGTMGN